MNQPRLTDVRACLIDLDGTLVDTVDDFTAAINAMLDQFGAAPLPRQKILHFIGKGSEHLIQSVLAETLPPARAATEFDAALACYQQAYATINGRHTTVYPHVREGLASLREGGLPLACITNKPHRFAVELLQYHDLEGFFELVYGGDSWPRKKPDPLPLLKACEALGVSPASAVLIGDSENDVMAARAAGCRVLTVPYGYNHGNAIQAADSDGIVASLFAAAQAILPAADHTASLSTN
ncbi:phosphoglycolate phosphatase [Pandoraea thiooxydans]|uniref:Phosphoglycolate phosphatase n=1 Tax=Pandoraea thiooxydans TaxID=445709 RepID=A0A0G3EVB9_9BURK|nr:phosphoglycolate phosphatase [Pandoraea thiooxydans]AKJ69939.1 phosphoglycolate phosphatase [Pandoraea thiooxydans]APR97722.1 phosphoglycolate phosphatase [Pandoraea thiooxydans]